MSTKLNNRRFLTGKIDKYIRACKHHIIVVQCFAILGYRFYCCYQDIYQYSEVNLLDLDQVKTKNKLLSDSI